MLKKASLICLGALTFLASCVNPFKEQETKEFWRGRVQESGDEVFNAAVDSCLKKGEIVIRETHVTPQASEFFNAAIVNGKDTTAELIYMHTFLTAAEKPEVYVAETFTRVTLRDDKVGTQKTLLQQDNVRHETGTGNISNSYWQDFR